MGGDAETAAVAGGCSNLHNLALGGRQAGARIDGADNLIGFKSGGGIGQDTYQVGQEAIVFLGGKQAVLGVWVYGVGGLDSKAGHGDRKSVGEGKRVSVRVNLGGR